MGSFLLTTDTKNEFPNAASGDQPPQIPLIDPTANVLALVAASITRQDDLRTAGERLQEERTRRQDELRIQAEKCANEVASLHQMYQRELAVAESNRVNAVALAETRRIDALLSADRVNVALASEKSTASAATLAQTVANSAEALRTQVTSLANQTTMSTNTMREALEKRLSLLEQNQYATGGRDVQRSENRQGGQWLIGLAVGGALAFLSLIVAVVAVAFAMSSAGGS